MDKEILKKAGLTDSQAKGYIALVQESELSPAELALKINESRTNTYAIIDKLINYGLISKKEDIKYGAKYKANHPSALETLAENRRKILVRNEQTVKDSLGEFIDYFYKFSEEPGARILQGIEGIKTIYEDTLKDKEDIYLIRTRADVQLLGEDFYIDYRKKRAAAGIITYSITPLSPEGKAHVKEGFDKQNLYSRTFIPDDIYTAPVEIDIYGNKVAFISFGNTQMATLIESPAISMAMRQLHTIIVGAFKDKSATVVSKLVN